MDISNDIAAEKDQMKINIRQKILSLAFIILAVMGGLGYAVFKSNQKLLDSAKAVEHTEEVIYQSGNIFSLAKDIETASRGFVITNDSEFLSPLFIAQKTAFVYIEQLRQLTLNDGEQQQKIDSLNFYMHRRLNFSLQQADIRTKQGLTAAIAYASTRQGKMYTDHIRQITDAIQQKENALLKKRRDANGHDVAAFNLFSQVIFLLMVVFTILLLISTGKYLLQNKEKEKRRAELVIVNKELAFQTEEKETRAAELTIANTELIFQNNEKEKRAAELIIANKELAFQTEEKETRAAELIVANTELVFQNNEKENRAAELFIANKELAFQNVEKEKRAAELIIANKELAFQNTEKENRAAELVIANTELVFQHKEKENRAAELIIANQELAFQNDEKEKRAAELTVANNELKNAEDNVRKLNEGLEQKVIKRTAELESVNKELESFSYSVSHDLRAPLRAVQGYARMLEEDYRTQFDPEVTRVMNNIISNSKKMGQLIDDLLAFSRLGRKELAKMDIPMQEVVTNICNELKTENANRDIQFQVNKLLPALGDSSAVKQVWVNLISNAVKYSRQNEKTIIEIGSEDKPGEIIYYIKDNGAGFDMRYAGKLFGVFQRLHSDNKFEGTGVGLAIVHRIISKHGGRVWAEGKVNEGAVFYFSLPKNIAI